MPSGPSVPVPKAVPPPPPASRAKERRISPRLSEVAGDEDVEEAALPFGEDLGHARQALPVAAVRPVAEDVSVAFGDEKAAVGQEGEAPGLIKVRGHLRDGDGAERRVERMQGACGQDRGDQGKDGTDAHGIHLGDDRRSASGPLTLRPGVSGVPRMSFLLEWPALGSAAGQESNMGVNNEKTSSRHRRRSTLCGRRRGRRHQARDHLRASPGRLNR